MSQPRLAILDDYQGVALTMADWSKVQSRVQIDVFRDTILDEDQLAQRLYPYAIVSIGCQHQFQQQCSTHPLPL